MQIGAIIITTCQSPVSITALRDISYLKAAQHISRVLTFQNLFSGLLN